MKTPVCFVPIRSCLTVILVSFGGSFLHPRSRSAVRFTTLFVRQRYLFNIDRMESLWQSVTDFFSPGDSLPWTDSQAIQACELDLNDRGQEKSRDDNVMKLSWALVHSKRESDVRRGIAMLEDQLRSQKQPDRVREVLYLLAVAWFRAGDYSRSLKLVEESLQENPNFRQGTSLKAMVEKKISSDGMIGIGIAAGATAVLVAGLAAAAAGGRR